MASILSFAPFPAPNCPSKHERIYASSPSPFHIKTNGPSSNYIAKKPRKNNRLNMTTFFSIASIPQQAEKDEDDSKQMLIERIRKYLDSLMPGGGLQVESLDEALEIVDLVQRLGIQRFFQQQIHHILESLYSKWDEKYGLTHANLTILGFRLLGFHGYHVIAGLAAAAAKAANIGNDHDNDTDTSNETKINSINVNEDNNNNTSTSTSTITTTTTETTTTPTTKEEQGQGQEQEQNNNKSLFVAHESQPDVRFLTN